MFKPYADTHPLDHCPGLVLHYTVISPGQEQTFEQEGLDPEIELNNIKLQGHEVSDGDFQALLLKNGDTWVQEVIKKLKRGKDDA